MYIQARTDTDTNTLQRAHTQRALHLTRLGAPGEQEKASQPTVLGGHGAAPQGRG